MHPEMMLMFARHRQREFWQEAERYRHDRLASMAHHKRHCQIRLMLRKALRSWGIGTRPNKIYRLSSR